MGTTTLIVRDPHHRSRVLVAHGGLTAREADALAKVYRALGYTGDYITIERASIRHAA